MTIQVKTCSLPETAFTDCHFKDLQVVLEVQELFYAVNHIRGYKHISLRICLFWQVTTELPLHVS